MQLACIDSATANSELTPLRVCIESMQSDCASCGSSVIKALCHGADGHMVNSQACQPTLIRPLSKTLQLSCILYQANVKSHFKLRNSTLLKICFTAL